MTEPVIVTAALRKQYGPTLAVAGLTLKVGAGEIFGFLGPNGAGKTTAIKMLLALVEPSGGSARVLGAPLGDRRSRARIGFLPEHFRFQESLTARELLRFHGRLHGLGGIDLESRIDALLMRVDLLDASDRFLGGYSKGMLQRAGLAQALINDPTLVFLDEPTSGLDPLGRLLVRDVIKELRECGTTVFLNSHLLGEVEATCDRVAFVKRGQLVHELLLTNSPAQFDLELEVAGIDALLVEGLREFDRSLTWLDDRHLRMNVANEQIVPEVVRWLVERRVEVHAVQPRRKSLEDVFVEVMGEDGRPG